MAQENEQPQTTPSTSQGGVQPGNGPGGNPFSNSDLQAECERLKQDVRRLQEELDTERRALRELRSEHEVYRRIAYTWARQQFAEDESRLTEEELQRLISAGKWFSLDDIIGEIEEITGGG
jgi:hypothetical protein